MSALDDLISESESELAGTLAINEVRNLAGCAVRIRADKASWPDLDLDLGPYLTQGGDQEPDLTLTVVSYPVPQSMARLHADGVEVTVQAFAGWSRFTASEVTWPDGRTLLLHANDVLCVVRRATRQIHVIGTAPAVPARLVLKDVIRALVWPSTLAVHASAVAMGGRVVCLPGASGSGKTTSVLELARYSEAAFMANDRVLLGPIGDQIVAWGWPARVRIGQGTLRRLDRRTTREGERFSEARGSLVGEKLELPTQEAERLLDTICPGPLPVGAMIFPVLVHGDGGGIEKLSPAAASVALAANCREWPEPGWPHWTGWCEGDRTNSMARDLVLRIADNIPSYVVRLPLDSPSVFSELILAAREATSTSV